MGSRTSKDFMNMANIRRQCKKTKNLIIRFGNPVFYLSFYYFYLYFNNCPALQYYCTFIV